MYNPLIVCLGLEDVFSSVFLLSEWLVVRSLFIWGWNFQLYFHQITASWNIGHYPKSQNSWIGFHYESTSHISTHSTFTVIKSCWISEWCKRVIRKGNTYSKSLTEIHSPEILASSCVVFICWGGGALSYTWSSILWGAEILNGGWWWAACWCLSAMMGHATNLVTHAVDDSVI